MRHFEDICNAAENLGKQLEENDEKTILNKLKIEIFNLENATEPEKKGEIIGNILYEICQICRVVPINSAAALNLAIETKLADKLDPD